jgi:hypothetical protein
MYQNAADKQAPKITGSAITCNIHAIATGRTDVYILVPAGNTEESQGDHTTIEMVATLGPKENVVYNVCLN